MNNPFSTLTKKEWLLWLCSLFIVLLSNILAANFDPLTLIAALVGVTSLVFAAKGNVWAQVLMIVFSILYGIISFRFRYWGEMITYLGMALPMAVWSAITWLRHPAESGDAVAIQKLNLRQFAGLLASCVVVTVLFYRILAALDTPNLAFSTLSVITSFLAAALTMLRSSYYALGYAANDVVILSADTASEVPQLPERCLSRKAGIVRCCLYTFLPCCLLRQGFFVSAALRRPIAKRPPARYNVAR